VKKLLLLWTVAIVFVGAIRAGGDDDWGHGPGRFQFIPGTLVLSRSVYVAPPSLLVPGVTVLPPGCVAGTVQVPLIAGGTVGVAVSCVTPTVDATYPTVFNNAAVDGHFGITSPIFLDDLTTDGFRLDTLAVPTEQIVTSFSSKSELSIHRSADGKSLTFMGYQGGPGFPTGANIFDVSNGNTPGLIDPTNAAVSQYYRAVAEVDSHGRIQVTDGNAYSIWWEMTTAGTSPRNRSPPPRSASNSSMLPASNCSIPERRPPFRRTSTKSATLRSIR
jgi:hypothetical protein